MRIGQKYKNTFLGFLVEMKTFLSAFEIDWPLVDGLDISRSGYLRVWFVSTYFCFAREYKQVLYLIFLDFFNLIHNQFHRFPTKKDWNTFQSTRLAELQSLKRTWKFVKVDSRQPWYIEIRFFACMICIYFCFARKSRLGPLKIWREHSNYPIRIWDPIFSEKKCENTFNSMHAEDIT